MERVDRRRRNFAGVRTRFPRIAVLAFALVFAIDPIAANETRSASPPTAEQARMFIRGLLVKSPYRIPAQARNGEIRYWLRFEQGLAWSWPDTGEQRIANASDGVVELRVCGDCGREAPPTQDALRRHSEANAWVRSDDRRIRAFARKHTRGGSVAARMERLVAAVQDHMNGGIEFHRYDDAVAALETRRGDCTEYAILLAASARALGIPTRLVHGVAYASRFTGEAHVFSPHAWVQVWDGQRWVSYDAGLGRFDAGHIALGIGDGTPQSMPPVLDAVRVLRIERAAGVDR
jgi:transglutaminase-like putative cysteine protease